MLSTCHACDDVLLGEGRNLKRGGSLHVTQNKSFLFDLLGLINDDSNNVHLYDERTNDSTVTTDDDLIHENEDKCQVETDVRVNIPDDITIKTNFNINEVNEVSPSKNEKLFVLIFKDSTTKYMAHL